MSNWLLNDVMLEEKVQVDVLLKFRAPGRDDAVVCRALGKHNYKSTLGAFHLWTSALRTSSVLRIQEETGCINTNDDPCSYFSIYMNAPFHDFARAQGPRQFAQ